MRLNIITDDKVLKRMLKNIKKGEVVRILHDGVDYGVHQEFGAESRNVPAHPFMRPALEKIRPAHKKVWKQVKNLEVAEKVIEKLARDAEGHAKNFAPVDTGNLKNSIGVSKPEAF